MSRKKKPLPLLENITITDIAAEGKSLARVDDLVVFVSYCVPGDVVDLQVRRKKHSYAEADVVRFHKYSELRVTPPCQHFGLCGGCKWQNLPYTEQLAFKQQQVYDQLTRIGKVQLPELTPILGSEQIFEYRNKLDFACCNKAWLTKEELKQGLPFAPAIGFHITGAFDKILPIDHCHLMHPLHNDIRNHIRDYAVSHDITFFDPRQQTGLLRDIIIRNSNSGEWMLIVQFHFDHSTPDTLAQSETQAATLLNDVADNYPQITSLLYLDNQKCNDTIGDQRIITFKGHDHIMLHMEGLRFKVGPKSFYQTNTRQATRLYNVVRQFAYDDPLPHLYNADSRRPLVYDLYTGTGTIANFVAAQAEKVIGIEYVPEAIDDAKVNADLNNITNTLFFAGDMKDILTDTFIQQHGRPDIIITDPPRAGMHPDVVSVILHAHPQRIVYVSCNPATQARDLQLLDNDYQVARVQPVDMFPHTPHVENVVLLQARQSM